MGGSPGIRFFEGIIILLLLPLVSSYVPRVGAFFTNGDDFLYRYSE